MRIELKSLHIQSIRDLDDMYIEFGSSKPNHLTTIQMPNGTGKTTTLSLFKCLFSGKDLTSQEVMDYKPTLYDASEGLAKLRITIDDLPYTIELHMNYDEGTYCYYTTSPDIRGHEEGHHIPSKYRLTPELVNLFVFNGEVATDLFKSSLNTAEQAIDCLYGLSKVEELVRKVNDQKQIVKNNSDTKITKMSTLAQKKKRLCHLMDCSERIKEENRITKQRIDEIDNKLSPIQEELDKLQNPEIRQRIELLKRDIINGESQIKSKTQRLKELVVNPMAISDYFSNSLHDLKNNMDILKLPRGTSSEFFQELCDSDSCICGTKITPEIKKRIIANSVKYLSDDLAGIMNSVKTEINTWQEDTKSYSETVSEISKLKRELRENQNTCTQLEKTFGGKDSHQRFAELLEQKNILEKEKLDCEECINYSTSPINDDPETNINLCEAEIKKLRTEIGAGDDLIRKLDQCDKAHKLLEEIYELAMKNLKKHVISLTNDTLYPIMGNEIVVENIDKAIILKGKPIGSEGQVLTTGYAYISALFKDSEFRVPFIIDSPCGSLDLSKRAYVAKKIPGLFDQVVFFVTSSERLRFTDVLGKAESLNPHTVWKENKGGKLIQISQELDVFNNFQMDEEE